MEFFGLLAPVAFVFGIAAFTQVAALRKEVEALKKEVSCLKNGEKGEAAN